MMGDNAYENWRKGYNHDYYMKHREEKRREYAKAKEQLQKAKACGEVDGMNRLRKPPEREGEMLVVSYAALGGVRQSMQFTAGRCVCCGKLSWVSEINKGLCFDCRIHQEALELQAYINRRLAKNAYED